MAQLCMAIRTGSSERPSGVSLYRRLPGIETQLLNDVLQIAVNHLPLLFHIREIIAVVALLLAKVPAGFDILTAVSLFGPELVVSTA